MKVAIVLVATSFVLGASALFNICPDSTFCGMFDTCCPAVTGFGCCIYSDAECCPNLISCCPEGYRCLGEHLCVKKGFPEPKICKGGEYICPPHTSCCSTNETKNDCCAFSDPAPCSDPEHYCPPGTICDEKDGSCILTQQFAENKQFATAHKLYDTIGNNTNKYGKIPWFNKIKPLPK